MTALLVLAVRLARAGGRFRVGAVLAGSAVATAVLVLALAVPAALASSPGAPAGGSGEAAAGVVAFLLAPVLVLLLVVVRLSSRTRDRRLASLRLLGMGSGAARVTAALETAVLTAPGVLLGAVAATAGAPWLDRAVQGAAGTLPGALRVRPVSALVVAAVVAGVCAVVGGATAQTGGPDPRAARAESTRRDPARWRLMLLGPPALMLGLVAVGAAGPSAPLADVWEVLLVGGALSGAVAVAFAAPVLTAVVADALTRRGGVRGLLAGRVLQVEPAGAARLVAGLAVATYVALAAFGVVLAVQATPQYRFAAQVAGAGPQPIALAGAAVSDADLDRIRDLPGVRGVVERDVVDVGCDPGAGTCAEVVVGTCADLAVLMTVTGCDDGRAALVRRTAVPEEWRADAPAPGDRDTLTIGRADPDSAATLTPTATLPVDGDPVVQDVAATAARWVYPERATVVVPTALARAAGLPGPRRLSVLADGGPEVAEGVVREARALGLDASPYPLDDLTEGQRVRTAVLALAGVVLGIGLLTLALGTADRALERRRPTTRLLALGAAPRTLRAAGAVQVLVPLGSALVLAVATGSLLLVAYLRDGPAGGEVGLAPMAGALAATVVVSTALTATASWPAVRGRITPEQLRSE